MVGAVRTGFVATLYLVNYLDWNDWRLRDLHHGLLLLGLGS